MDSLLRLWGHVPLPGRIGFAVLSGVMTVLGLPSVGENAAGWCAWLAFVGSNVGRYIFPVLGLVGLTTFIGLQIAELRARKSEPSSEKVKLVSSLVNQTDDRTAATKRHARHVIGELERSDETTARALKRGAWWDVNTTGLQFKEWEAARDLLAENAPAAYDTVDTAYALVDRLNTAANQDKDLFGPAGLLSSVEGRADIERFRALIPPTVAKLRAYCDGDRAVAPSDESVDHEQRLTQAQSDDPLKRKLMRERVIGQRMLSSLGLLGQGSGLTPRARPTDVDAWEATVRHLLHRKPDLLTIFNHDPPKSPFIETTRSFHGKLGARLRRRLAQLDKVIEDF